MWCLLYLSGSLRGNSIREVFQERAHVAWQFYLGSIHRQLPLKKWRLSGSTCPGKAKHSLRTTWVLRSNSRCFCTAGSLMHLYSGRILPVDRHIVMIGTLESPFTLCSRCGGSRSLAGFASLEKQRWRSHQGCSQWTMSRQAQSEQSFSICSARRRAEQGSAQAAWWNISDSANWGSDKQHNWQRQEETEHREAQSPVYIDFCQMNVIGDVQLFVSLWKKNNSIFLLFLLNLIWTLWCFGVMLVVFAKASVTVAFAHICGLP